MTQYLTTPYLTTPALALCTLCVSLHPQIASAHPSDILHTHEVNPFFVLGVLMLIGLAIWLIVINTGFINAVKSTLKHKVMKKLLLPCVAFTAIFATVMVKGTAFAHHPIGGTTPKNFTEGILSGFGHPMIELDHFAFLLLAGFLAYVTRSYLLLAIGVAALSLMGTLVAVYGVDISGFELLIGFSILLAATLILLAKKPLSPFVLVVIPALMFFHGYAYAEAIIGAETTPLLAYLFGLSFIQFCIVGFIGEMFRLLEKVTPVVNHKKFRFLVALPGIAFAGYVLYPTLVSTVIGA